MMGRKIEEWVISVDMSDPLEYNHTIIKKKPLVRCRDCKLYHDKRGCFWSEGSDGFCAWGERKASG